MASSRNLIDTNSLHDMSSKDILIKICDAVNQNTIIAAENNELLHRIIKKFDLSSCFTFEKISNPEQFYLIEEKLTTDEKYYTDLVRDILKKLNQNLTM